MDQREFETQLAEQLKQLAASNQAILEAVQGMTKPDRATEGARVEASRAESLFAVTRKFGEARRMTRAQTLAELGQLSPSDLRRSVDSIQDVRVLHALTFGE